MPTRRAQVRLLATGGTIANPPDIEGYLPGRELVAGVPELEEVAEVVTTDVASVASQRLTAEHLLTLHDHAMAAADEGADGIVVTSGSNASEELAYFLNLTLDTDVPVVATAAQRNRGTVGNDGDRNLLDAVRVAAHRDARGRGVLVVVNDEIHAARDVHKQVSSRPDAWSSGDLGALGYTDKYGRIGFYRRVEREHTTATPFDPAAGYDPDGLSRIAVLYSCLDDDGRLVRAAREADVEGIVVAAFPTGHFADPLDGSSQHDALLAAAEDGLQVVVCHRGTDGWNYAYRDATSPFIPADDLSPQKARILLYLALQETDDREQLRSFFARF